VSRAARHRRKPRRQWLVSLASGAITGIAVGSLLVLTGVTDPGGTANAVDSSAVTVSANQQDLNLESAPMPDLSVTVSQTRDLLAQGIQVDIAVRVLRRAPGQRRVPGHLTRCPLP